MLKNYLPVYSLLLIISTCVPAQGQDKSIEILVVDQTLAVVIDAAVFLNQNRKVVVKKPTDRNGTVIFRQLKPGIYKVLVTSVNFEPFSSEIELSNSSQRARLTVILKIKPVTTELNIKLDIREDDFDQNEIKVLTEEDIKKLPDDPGELKRVLQEMAGTSVTGEALPINVEGFNDSELPPKEAIRQIRFDRNIFSSQYEDVFGGGIQVYTKAYVKKYRYGLTFNFGTSKLNASNPYIFAKLPYRHANSRIYILGPLLSKSASFIFDYRHRDEKSSKAVNATVLGPSLQPRDFREVFRSPRFSEDIRTTVRSDLNTKHSVYFNYRLQNIIDKDKGVGGFALPSRVFDQKQTFHDIKIAETFFLNKNIVTQTRARIKYGKNKTLGRNNETGIIVQDAFSSGGSQVNNSASDFYLQLTSNTAWALGNHELRFGGSFRLRKINQEAMSNFIGTYTFTGKLAPILDMNDLPVLDSKGGFQTMQISSLESYRRTTLFSSLGHSPVSIRSLGGGANHFTLSGGSPSISSDLFDASLYIQDNFKLNKNLALSLGVRFEQQSDIRNSFDVAPRMGVVWFPKNNGESIFYSLPTIRAGFGFFYSRFGVDNLLELEKANATGRSEYFITDPNILDLFPNVPNTNMLERFTISKINRTLSKNVKAPIQTIFNIAISKKLPKKILFNINYSRGNNDRQIVTRNITPSFDDGFLYETSSFGKKRWSFFNLNLMLLDTLRLPALRLKIQNPRISYGYRSSMDNITQGSGNPVDAFDFNNEYSKSNDDGTHRVSTSFFVELIAGVTLTNFINYQSAGRFNIITGSDTNGDGFFTERPSFATDPNKEGVIQTAYGLLDPRPTGAENIIPRNLGKGFSSFNWDLSISKSFLFGVHKTKNKPGRYSVNLSAYIRNVTNTNNKGNPIGNSSSPNFLLPLSYNSTGSVSVSTSAGTFRGFGGRTFNFSASFRF